MPDYGTARADFPGGDAGLLYRSIRRILELPADTHLNRRVHRLLTWA
jgi:glyoxylase-like metal-dependent hydrolase (beta-lactamase superfamily II)